MNWQELCEYSPLQNLPFKIELDEHGRIIMTPVKIYHSAYQGKISVLLDKYLNGQVLVECAIKTHKGTKVADVAWVSSQRFTQIREETDCSIAPEICVEILLSSNSTVEMAEKRQLYFAQGAQEVWLCSETGQMDFYNQQGKLIKSALAPQFPEEVKI